MSSSPDGQSAVSFGHSELASNWAFLAAKSALCKVCVLYHPCPSALLPWMLVSVRFSGSLWKVSGICWSSSSVHFLLPNAGTASQTGSCLQLSSSNQASRGMGVLCLPTIAPSLRVSSVFPTHFCHSSNAICLHWQNSWQTCSTFLSCVSLWLMHSHSFPFVLFHLVMTCWIEPLSSFPWKTSVPVRCPSAVSSCMTLSCVPTALTVLHMQLCLLRSAAGYLTCLMVCPAWVCGHRNTSLAIVFSTLA